MLAKSFLSADRIYPGSQQEPLNPPFILPRRREGEIEGAMSRSVTLAALIGAVALSCGTARAEPLFAFLAPAAPTQLAPQTAALAPADDEDQAPVDARLRRQIVNYSGHDYRLRGDSEFRRAATDGADLGVNFVTLVRTMGTARQRMRLVAVEHSTERLLGEYTFNHAPHDSRA